MVSAAAGRADVIDVGQLPPEVLAGNTRHLSRIEAFERGEIIRVLGADGLTMAEAARELGMSRATLYRKIAQYNIQVPRTSLNGYQAACWGSRSSACLLKQMRLPTKASTAVAPAAAAMAASDAPQLARLTAMAITDAIFRKSPVVAMASDAGLSEGASRSSTKVPLREVGRPDDQVLPHFSGMKLTARLSSCGQFTWFEPETRSVQPVHVAA